MEGTGERKGRRLGQRFLVVLFVEPYEQSLAYFQGRCPEVAGWAQHRDDDLFVQGLRGREDVDSFSLRHHETGCFSNQLYGVCAPQLARGRDDLRRLDPMRVQELGRPPTGRSSAAVVVPGYFLGHTGKQ